MHLILLIKLQENIQNNINEDYGKGLIPESAPMVDEIANIFSNYYLGKST